jgi:hypothetical protein
LIPGVHVHPRPPAQASTQTNKRTNSCKVCRWPQQASQQNLKLSSAVHAFPVPSPQRLAGAPWSASTVTTSLHDAPVTRATACDASELTGRSEWRSPAGTAKCTPTLQDLPAWGVSHCLTCIGETGQHGHRHSNARSRFAFRQRFSEYASLKAASGHIFEAAFSRRNLHTGAASSCDWRERRARPPG